MVTNKNACNPFRFLLLSGYIDTVLVTFVDIVFVKFFDTLSSHSY